MEEFELEMGKEEEKEKKIFKQRYDEIKLKGKTDLLKKLKEEEMRIKRNWERKKKEAEEDLKYKNEKEIRTYAKLANEDKPQVYTFRIMRIDLWLCVFRRKAC